MSSFVSLRLGEISPGEKLLFARREIILTNSFLPPSFSSFKELVVKFNGITRHLFASRIAPDRPTHRRAKLFPELYTEEKIYIRVYQDHIISPIASSSSSSSFQGSRPIVPAPEVSFSMPIPQFSCIYIHRHISAKNHFEFERDWPILLMRVDEFPYGA